MEIEINGKQTKVYDEGDWYALFPDGTSGKTRINKITGQYQYLPQGPSHLNTPPTDEMILKIKRALGVSRDFRAVRLDGTEKIFQSFGAASRWLMGLEDGQTLDDFEYPAPGGSIYDEKLSWRCGAVGVDGGGVAFEWRRE